ncbi:glutamate 5-kinase [Pararhodospirillum oryzae]|uniref:Glutamate 5-kinase n=1 Tax=Pararhodospirillum oryzae TaxID=478448 RepID=A0A512HA96_9PROT|nr:glutamate 5-kinase [Pararhodospirillum oryzae]GEO82365.1 glutamate 5-kinase [Pararhodospirillum oryzae]
MTTEQEGRGIQRLEHAKRVVLKIGSALLVDDATGLPRRPWLEALVDDVLNLRRGGREVLIVSSGAVAVGRRSLGLDPTRPRVQEKQAAAAVGQIRLAHAYQEILARHGVTAAQVLLTLDDSENRRRYLNARGCIETLLGLGAVPVINENDTVTTQEIRFGDNDRLAARVAQMMSADVLVLFSDIDGLYTADPNKDPTARFIPEVPALTPEILAMGTGALTAHGTGGMVTKLVAADICMEAGCAMVIAPGKGLHPVQRLREGGRCTWFLPSHEPHAARKAWILGSLKAEGQVMVDDGAVRALAHGRSLLPAGVRAIEGEFQRGAAVRVVNLDGDLLAKGLIAYPADEARLLMGHKSGEIEALLGYRGRDELIHRDDMVLDGILRAPVC